MDIFCERDLRVGSARESELLSAGDLFTDLTGGLV